MRAEAPRISACIVCRNEADRLGPCLKSIQWVDEIVVMDLASTDESAALARQHGARVLVRERASIVEMVRNEVAAEAIGEWILVLDPDERVTPGLAAELRAVAGHSGIDAVIVPRMNYDFGYPPSHPLQRYEPQLRMYRPEKVTWPSVPNALPEVPSARVHIVPHRDDLVLVHDRSRTVSEVLERVLRYAPLQAQSMIDRGETFTARAMLVTLAGKAHKQFIQGEALKDGVPGFLRASILVAFHFYVWASFWQLSGTGRTEADDRFLRRLAAPIQRLRRTGRMLRAPYRILARRRKGNGKPVPDQEPG